VQFKRSGHQPIAPAGRVLLWALALGPVLAYVGLALSRVLQDPNAHDWKAYAQAADRLLAGRTPYVSWQLSGPYGLGDLDKPFAYAYPPSAILVLAPFLATFELWSVFNVAVYLAGVLAVVSAASGLSPVRASLALWMAVVPPFLWDGVNGGGITPALAGSLGFIYAGVPLAGLGGAIKLYPFAWVALSLRSGIRRALVGVAVGFGIPAAFSVVAAGFGPWADWLVVLRNTGPACGRDVQSLVCEGVPQQALWLAGAALFFISFRLPRPWALLVLGLTPIVAAPQVWAHYFLLIVPGVVAVVLSFLPSPGAGRSGGGTPPDPDGLALPSLGEPGIARVPDAAEAYVRSAR
jgi:hypothetical protein